MNQKNIQSMGGKARAKTLTPQQRKQSAKNAAKARWSFPKVQWGAKNKRLKLGNQELECYVLADGRRIITLGSIQQVLQLKVIPGKILNQLLAQTKLKAFPNKHLTAKLAQPIKFINPKQPGKIRFALPARLLPRICRIILKAMKNQPKGKNSISVRCKAILGSLNKANILALVDKAAGYQSRGKKARKGQYKEKKQQKGKGNISPFLLRRLAKWAKASQTWKDFKKRLEMSAIKVQKLGPSPRR